MISTAEPIRLSYTKAALTAAALVACTAFISISVEVDDTDRAEEPILACHEPETGVGDIDGDGDPDPIGRYLYEEAMTRAGYSVIWHELTWGSCLAIVHAGTLDVVTDGFARDGFYQPNRHAVLRRANLIVLDESPIYTFHGWHQFAGKKVGRPHGYITTIEGDEAPVFVEMPDVNVLVSALADGKIDAIATALDGIDDLARSKGIKVRRVPRQFIYQAALWNPSNKNVADAVAEEMAKMVESGEVDRIYREQFGWERSDILSHVVNRYGKPIQNTK